MPIPPLPRARTWTFTRNATGWTMSPFQSPLPVDTLVRWTLAHDLPGFRTSATANDQLRQTLLSALRPRAVPGTRVTVTREANGLLLVETLDPAMGPGCPACPAVAGMAG